MKYCLSRLLGNPASLAALLLALLLAPAADAALTFTITPSAISNTYSGSLTLLVSGTTNGETVVVQKYLDVNANGVVDAGDWLVQQFTLTDGQPGMVIAGVTNANVPGDGDGLTTQITAKFKFASGDFMQTLVGSYALVLSSPSGHFPAITNFLTLTNVPYGQSLSGTVYSNGTAVPAPNSVVLVFPPPRPGKGGPGGNPIVGGVTDAAGHYNLPAPAGTYMPAAFRGGFVTDFSTVPVVALSAGQTLTTNLTLTSATASISGSVVDSANPSTGLPAVFVAAQTQTGLMGVTATDTNGNFTVGVAATPTQWWLNPNDTSLLVHGYLGLQDKVSGTPGQTGLALAVPRATALFYGTVKDPLGNPLAGIDVYASDSNSQYETDAYTDAKGNYFAGALAGGWDVQLSSDSNPANYIFSGDLNLIVTNAEAIPWSFAALLATNQISGSLKDNFGNPIPNINIWASAMIGGVYYNQGNARTDSSGNYSLAIANGTWSVGVNSGGGGNSLPTNYICSTSQSIVISNNNATANFTALLATNQITGFVRRASGNPIAGLGVWGSATIGGITYSVETGTDGSGNYSLVVAAGNWNVGVNCNGGGGNWSTLDNLLGPGTYQCPGGQLVNVLASNPVADFTVEPLQTLQMTTTSLPGGTVGQFYHQSLNASGGQPPYSWWLPGGLVSLPPTASGDMSFSSNGTNATISGVPSAPGTYPFWVGVYDSASPQNAVTQMFSITINPRPSLGSPAWHGNQFLMRLTGAAGQNYTVQMATSLTASNWTTLFVTNNLATNSFIVLDPAAADHQRFYRVEVGP